MADTSSVYKICPHCGQSVSVAAKFCPTCGSPFTAESSDFVAYERYSTPETQQPTQQMTDATMTFTPVSGQPGNGTFAGQSQQGNTEGITPNVSLYVGPDHSGSGAVNQPRPVAPGAPAQTDPFGGGLFQDGASMDQQEQGYHGVQSGPTMAEAAQQNWDFDDDDGSTPPPMGGRPGGPDDDRRRKGIIVTAVAAVLLIAVVVAGVVMAFKLGVVGGEDTEDPMTRAQEA